MWYLPPACLLQSATALSYEPPGSLKTYQLMAVRPLPPSLLPTPHAASPALAMSAAMASRCRPAKSSPPSPGLTLRKPRLTQSDHSCVRGEPAVAQRARVRLYTRLAAGRAGPLLRRRVQGDRPTPAPEGEHALGGVDQLELRRQLAPQGDQLAHERQHRRGVVALLGDVALRRVDGRQPGRPVAEAAVGRAVPLHRVAVAVAPGAVVALAARPLPLADLVTLVEEGRAGQRQQQQRRGAGVVRAEARRQPAEVVVRQRPGRAGQPRGRLDRRAQRRRLPRSVQQLEG